MPANQDATFRIYENVGYQGVDTVPVQVGTFRVYENVGYQAVDDVPTKEGTFRIYENVGFYLDPLAGRSPAFESYLNTGLTLIAPTTDATAVAYENIGLQAGTRVTIVRQPRGWGVLPNGPQTIVMLGEASAGTAEAYENIQ
jgi:hypothetical protein